MISLDVWPRPPSCACNEWWDGWASGYLTGHTDARAQIAAEQLEGQERAAARMEPAASVIAGLKAVSARQDASPTTKERRAA